MSQNYFDRKHLPQFGRIAEGNPALADAFFSYYGAAFEDGTMGARQKSLIALAVAHLVQCPYCIDAYTSGSLEAGSDLEQMSEAVHVAAAVRGGSVLAYGTQMMALAAKRSMGGAPGETLAMPESYFDRSHVEARDRAMATEAPGLQDRFVAYEQHCFDESALSTGEKYVIALACAHTLQSPYGIDDFTRRALEHGATLAALTEAIHVAVAIRGGASLIHGLQMMEHANDFAKRESA